MKDLDFVGQAFIVEPNFFIQWAKTAATNIGVLWLLVLAFWLFINWAISRK